MVSVSKEKVRVLPHPPTNLLKGKGMNTDDKMNALKADIAQICSGIIKEPEAVLGMLTSDMYKMKDVAPKLVEMAKTIQDGSDANVRKQLFNTMVTLSRLCESQARTLAILHIYVLGGNSQADAGKAAMTVGVDGEDVLRTMLKAKFG